MDIKALQIEARSAVKKAQNTNDLEEVRVVYLGRKNGKVITLLRSLKNLSLTERRQVGPKANTLRHELEELIKKRSNELQEKHTGADIDVTRPGNKMRVGHLHPLTQIEREVRDIFTSLNFSVLEGPEIESDYYNFDALNIPPDHPARDMWDTFWLKQSGVKKGKSLLRTHTSPMQIRYMETHKPPFQIIVPGRVFRYEATDASHEINFYQVEGLMVGKHVTLANFKYIVETFLQQLFDDDVQFRFRPSYFPFVEPGIEVDIKLPKEHHRQGGTWLEVMGAGMVHRNIFDAVRYDPREVQGFAFGMGLDRLAMIKYNIPDIRLFYSGDLRFVRQF